MGRVKTRKTEIAPAPPAQGEIVPDGDYAGMTYEEATTLTIQSVEDAYGPLSLEGVCMVHDYLLQEILEVCRQAKGDAYAREAAERFSQTLEPFLDRPDYEQVIFAELLKLKQRAEG